MLYEALTQGDEPNTRTFLRPGALTALWLVGCFATQHVFTAAQGSYTGNILRELDPDRTVFTSVLHRDLVAHHSHDADAAVIGKDITLLRGIGERRHLPLERAILFDDRLDNFTPQPANGVHVKKYDEAAVQAGDDHEMARLVGITMLSLLAPDVRPVLRAFQSEKHKAAFRR